MEFFLIAVTLLVFQLRAEETSATMTQGKEETEQAEYGTCNTGLSCKEDDDDENVYENLELHVRKDVSS